MTVDFGGAQFDGTHISPNVQIAGSNGNGEYDEIDVFMTSANPSFSIAGWSFSNWEGIVAIHGTGQADTMTGSSDCQALFFGGAGADHMTAGSAGGGFEYLHPGDIVAGETIDGADIHSSGLDILGQGAFDFRPVSMANIGVVNFQKGNAVAKFDAAQFASAGLYGAAAYGPNATIEIDAAHHLDLSSFIYDLSWNKTDILKMIGTGQNDVLTGTFENDRIDGRGGDDTMRGGKGADTYIVNSVRDIVDERHGNGVDLVESAVNFSLAGSRTFGRVENLKLTGHDTLSAEGNDYNNIITGNDADNLLTGAGGKGRFVFDTKPGASNLDEITDFTAGSDKIGISKAIFQVKEVQGGTLVSVPLAINRNTFYVAAGATSAHDANDRFIYDTTSGALYFDKDGKGHAAAVEIALLDGAPGLASGDFVLVA